jgi:hypothetical protein
LHRHRKCEEGQSIAELEAEFEALQRQALALGAGISGLPPAVVLGVRIAETKATRAA